ncbi:unnamed protein product [Arctogadus glacialis]
MTRYIKFVVYMGDGWQERPNEAPRVPTRRPVSQRGVPCPNEAPRVPTRRPVSQRGAPCPNEAAFEARYGPLNDIRVIR